MRMHPALDRAKRLGETVHFKAKGKIYVGTVAQLNRNGRVKVSISETIEGNHTVRRGCTFTAGALFFAENALAKNEILDLKFGILNGK